MATDAYGQEISIGDKVTKIGSCDEFIISNIKYGGDMVDLSGYNWDETDVNSNNIVKVG